MARPTKLKVKKVSLEERQEVRDAFELYIAENEDPRLAGFLANDAAALKYWVSKDNMYDWSEMRPLLDRAHLKQEDYLNKKGMAGQAIPMAIFRLKQPWHGYKDRFEQDVTSGGEKITFVNSVPRPNNDENTDRRRKKYGKV